MTKNKQQSNSKVKRLDRIVLLAIIPVVLIAGLAIYTYTSIISREYYKSAQKDMQNYLEKKYSKSFTVGLPTTKSAGLGVEGVVSTSAYPNDDPGLQFNILRSSNGYTDYYPAAVWSREEKIPEYITSLNSDIKYEVTANATLDFLDKQKSPLPSYSTLMKEQPNELRYIIQASRTDAKSAELTEDDKKIIESLVILINQKQLSNRNVVYEVNSAGPKESTVCSISKDQGVPIQLPVSFDKTCGKYRKN